MEMVHTTFSLRYHSRQSLDYLTNNAYKISQRACYLLPVFVSPSIGSIWWMYSSAISPRFQIASLLTHRFEILKKSVKRSINLSSLLLQKTKQYTTTLKVLSQSLPGVALIKFVIVLVSLLRLECLGAWELLNLSLLLLQMWQSVRERVAGSRRSSHMSVVHIQYIHGSTRHFGKGAANSPRAAFNAKKLRTSFAFGGSTMRSTTVAGLSSYQRQRCRLALESCIRILHGSVPVPVVEEKWTSSSIKPPFWSKAVVVGWPWCQGAHTGTLVWTNRHTYIYQLKHVHREKRVYCSTLWYPALGSALQRYMFFFLYIVW